MRLLVGIVASIVLNIFTQKVYSECVEPHFVIPSSACLNESVQVINDMESGVYKFEWDFCSGDLKSLPEVEVPLVNSNFFRARSIRFVQEAGNWHAFSISATSNNLMRLDFGADLNNTPSFHNLGNIAGMLSSSFAFDIIQFDGISHIFVANGGNKNVLRLSFYDGITNSPTAFVLETPGVFDDAGPNFIRVVEDGDIFYAFVSVGTSALNSKIVTLTMGSALNLTPASSAFTIAGSNQLRGLSFFKYCGTWIGFALSSNTNSLYRLNFEDGLANPPINTLVDTKGTLLNTPVNIEVRLEGGVFYAFIQNSRIEEQHAALYRVSFGTSLNGPVERVEKLQMETLTGGAYALDIVDSNSSWHAFTFNLADQSLLRMDFAQECAASIPASLLENPDPLRYTAPGKYYITLNIRDQDGNVASKIDSLEISVSSAPDIDFTVENECANHDINFTSLNESRDVEAYKWQFGDGQTSSDPDAVHQFASAGTFLVNLTVTGSNGCDNFATKMVKVYDKPQADFQTPPGLICTNNELPFTATTPDLYDGHLSYQWFVEGVAVHNDRDLFYTFHTTGEKQIVLQTSIPGCSDRIEKLTSFVHAGPAVDFTHAGLCEDETFLFNHLITEPVVGYYWDFDNGNTSRDESPTQTFTEFGDFAVSLTATSSVGCENTKVITISVASKPLVDFSINGTPNGCTNSQTTFENESHNPDAREIVSWHWTFGDQYDATTTGGLHGTHVYADPGTYPVSLTATTAAGCTSTLEEQITIHPSPSTAFTHTPACEDVPVKFTSPDDPSIESYYWEFGTSYSYDASPTHTFAAPGDYPLYAEFHATNGCISTVEKTIHVPVPLTPNFSVIKNCVDHQAIFTDITNGLDAVATRMWDFGDGSGATTSPVNHLFTRQEAVPVTLQVTGQSGCSYATTKQVEILPKPAAEFSASPETGAYPLGVMFTNTSAAADQFEWKFFDGTGNTSDAQSPEYTFSTLGTFDVTLTAYNAQQCEDSFTKSITTVAPLPDADIEMITLAEQPDGSTKVIVTIHNKGNTILKDLPMAFDFAGDLSLAQAVEEPIMPGAQFNFILNSAILNAQNLAYLCVTLDVENDLSPGGNRSCSALETELLVFPAYPNPASGGLQVEWISPPSQSVKLSLIDRLGRAILREQMAHGGGLASRNIDVRSLPAGLYLLIVEDGTSQRVQRITVER